MTDAAVPLPWRSQPNATDSSGLHLRVLDDLGRAICEGELAVDSIVTAEGLENHFGVSRSVIRESLRALENMGMVASKRRVGYRIQPLSEWNVYDLSVIRWRLAGRDRLVQLESLTQLRAAIEPAAASLAAKHASAEQAGELLSIAGRLWAAGSAGNPDEFLRVDVEFHTLVLELSGNEMFRRLNSLVSEILVGRTNYGLVPERPHPDALRLHMDVANGIRDASPDVANSAMIAIMQRSINEMSELWTPAPPPN